MSHNEDGTWRYYAIWYLGDLENDKLLFQLDDIGLPLIEERAPQYIESKRQILNYRVWNAI